MRKFPSETQGETGINKSKTHETCMENYSTVQKYDIWYQEEENENPQLFFLSLCLLYIYV